MSRTGGQRIEAHEQQQKSYEKLFEQIWIFQLEKAPHRRSDSVSFRFGRVSGSDSGATTFEPEATSRANIYRSNFCQNRPKMIEYPGSFSSIRSIATEKIKSPHKNKMPHWTCQGRSLKQTSSIKSHWANLTISKPTSPRETFGLIRTATTWCRSGQSENSSSLGGRGRHWSAQQLIDKVLKTGGKINFLL